MLSALRAQSPLFATLSGKVHDAEGDTPLASVNVFLANTMLGAQTKANGDFEIRNVPFGNYELIVSMIGYEVQQKSLRVAQAKLGDLAFALKSRVLSGPEVEVVGETPKDWRKNLEKFEKFFWGSSKYVEQCRILNPEVLDFKAEEESRWFTATARQPLLVENRALGYRINLILMNFEYQERDNEIRYSLIPRFEQLLAESAAEEKRWEKNRATAHRGSMRHFLNALAAQQSWEEGFQICALSRLPWEEGAVKQMMFKPERMMTTGELPNERWLRFENCLEISFNNDRKKTSWMVAQKDSVLMNTAGYVYNGADLFVYGYWFHQRLAEALPREYEPTEE